MKIFINLYFIRESNGLFYFAKDLFDQEKFKDKEVIIISRKKITNGDMYKNFISAKHTFLKLNIFGFLYQYFKLILFQNKVITPTFHPLPFLSDQLVIIHDDYPYLGGLGKIKLYVLKLFLKLSRTTIGVINKNKLIPFLLRSGLVKKIGEILFLPNYIRLHDSKHKKLRSKKPLHPSLPLRIGLAGTDSSKKNYENFFSSLPTEYKFYKFLIYGNDNDYFRKIKKMFSNISIQLIDSDKNTPFNFIDKIDLLCQVNDMEGFGRINGYALLSGLPVFMLESDVNNEFFVNSANIFPTLDKLIYGITNFESWISNPDIYMKKLFLSHEYQCRKSLRAFLEK